MAKQTKWIELMWVALHFQPREQQRDGEIRELRLGPTAELKALGRKAKYEVAILAGLCGVCERTLERYMQADYGESPSSWLGTLQITDAIPLICKGMLMKEVAAQLHFHKTDFPRAFKRHTGYTPMQFYRAWVQNGREDVEDVD